MPRYLDNSFILNRLLKRDIYNKLSKKFIRLEVTYPATVSLVKESINYELSQGKTSIIYKVAT